MKSGSQQENDWIFAETPKEELLKITTTTGNQKIWSYFLDLLRNKSFQRTINNIREHLLDNKNKPKDISKFRNAIKLLCRRFGLDELMWIDTLERYIIENKIPKENSSTSCIVLDRLENGEDEYPDGYYKENEIGIDTDIPNEPKELESWSYSHPVIIRVSPYASQREIIDYVKKFYVQYIKPIQERYKDNDVNLGKIRKKKTFITERNDFIWENRNLGPKKIMKLLGDKYGWDDRNKIIDYAHISKIISLRKKRENN